MIFTFITPQIVFEHVHLSRHRDDSFPVTQDHSPKNTFISTPFTPPTAMSTSFSTLRSCHISYDDHELTNDNRKSSVKRARAVSSGSTLESRGFHLSRSKFYSRRSFSVITNKGSGLSNSDNNANSSKSPQGSVLSIYTGHGAASSSSTTLVRFYSAAKLAPPVAGANVEEYVRSRDDEKVKYNIQVHPHNVNLPFLDNMPIPRKTYSIYRRYEDILEFAEQLEEEFPWLRTSQVSVSF